MLDGIEKLPKLLEDIVQTSINTGPRGALRLAQGIQAVIGVGSEWLTDASKVDSDNLSFVKFFFTWDGTQVGSDKKKTTKYLTIDKCMPWATNFCKETKSAY